MRELLNTGVNISLDYYEKYDALIGQVKGYSVAVKENLSTGSYGCLFWIRKGEFGALTTAEQYLEEQQKKNPDFIKKFMVNDTGVAVALSRTDDDFANINNLKRFIYDFTTSLSRNNYVNCCCECGTDENPAIYDANGVIAQACPACGGKYIFICGCAETASAAVIDTPPVQKTEETVVPEPAKEEIAAPAEETTLAAEETAPDAEETAAPDEEAAADEKEEISSFAEFEYKPEEKAEEPVPVAAAANETEEFSLKEFEYDPEEKAEEPAPIIKEEEPTDISEFMYDESEKEEAPEAQMAQPAAESAPTENFDSLLYEEAKPEPERPRSLIFEQAEREFAEEKARMAAEAAAEEAKLDDAVDNLLIENGDIVLKEITPETDDGSHDVTEVYDDSNDGEDFDIEEIESTVEMPTVTTGHPQLEAEETPLEEDGSVPLINPNSHREERHVSPVDGPDAVQPLDYGQARVTYEKLSEETAPRFSAGDGINRGDGSQTPPPYNPDVNYSSYVKKVSYSDKSNAFMGIIGALVLGLVGLVAWIAIAHFFDVISVWGCLAIILTVYGGYYLGGRALDKKGIVISFILTLVMVAAGVVGMSVADVMADFKEEFDLTLSFRQAIEWTISSLQFEEARKAFVSNAAVSMIATLIGDIVAAVSFWKKA